MERGEYTETPSPPTRRSTDRSLVAIFDVGPDPAAPMILAADALRTCHLICGAGRSDRSDGPSIDAGPSGYGDGQYVIERTALVPFLAKLGRNIPDR